MTKITKNIICDIFKITYISLISGLIDELLFIKILIKLKSNRFNFSLFENIKFLILYLEHINIINSYQALIIFYAESLFYNKLSDFSYNFSDLGNIFSNKKCDMIFRMNKISDLLNNKLKLINAFRIEQIQFDSNYVVDTDIWKYEIIDRMKILINKYFSIEQIQYFGIIPLKLSFALNMNYLDINQYYCHMIHTIENNFDDIINCCDNIILITHIINQLQNIY
jgi:hypothetical protein